MINQLTVKRLTISEAANVQSCFDSQPKVMMTTKKPGREPYAQTFCNLLQSGCVAYGAFDGDVVQAFCVVWPWPTLPASTLVMACNRPDGKIYNPQRSGFSATLDACIRHMERDGRRIAYYVRSSGRAWKNSTAQRGLGIFEKYRCTVAEHIPIGCVSKHSDFNRFVLGNIPVSSDAVVIAAVAPMDGDF